MRTSNPVLSEKAFEAKRAYGAGETMSIQGVVNKSFFLLFLVFLSASWMWSKIFQPVPQYQDALSYSTTAVMPFMMGGAFIGFILAMVTVFKMQWSKVTAPLYSICEGLFLGGISAIFELRYPGIVLQAVGLTFGVLFSLLLAYKSGFVRVTDKFRLGVTSATMAICLFYLGDLILRFFGSGIPWIHQGGMLGIGLSLIIVIVAALNLVLDFDLIESLASRGAPKYMEWYGAFALMVTLIWLYLEILRLLAKLNQRR